MEMKRHYYVSDNLDDLENVEEELENAGVSTFQIHVLSQRTGEVARHKHLHEVHPFMKKDIAHSMAIGAIVGLLVCTVVMTYVYVSGWTEAAGWLPFVFLGVMLFGFCTWEGGLIGIQQPNHHFRRFQRELNEGKSVFFVDVEPEQEAILQQVLSRHPLLQDAGLGESTPHWFIECQKKTAHFFKQVV